MVEWKLYPAASFTEIVQQWQSLNETTANSPLLQPRFVEPLLNHFGGNKLIIIVIGFESYRCIAAGVFVKQGFGRWQTFQPSQAPVGLWLCHNDSFNSRLLSSLANALPGFAVTLGFTQLDPHMLQRPEESATIKTLDYITTARLAVPKDFTTFWQSRSKNLRQNYSKAKNRLIKEAVDIQLEVLSDPISITTAVSDYGQIESLGWKNQGGTAIHPDNEQGKFYTQLLEAFAPSECEVWRYRYNDKIVASNLCIHDDDVLIILKTTYDEAWQRYSPAFSMQLDGIQHCTEKGYRTIEFFGPTMAWHQKLTGDTRTIYHLNWYRSPALPWIKKSRQYLMKKLGTSS